MVSPSKPENAQSQIKYTNIKKGTKTTTAVKGPKAKTDRTVNKPFSSKIVYLDLKNRKESANLETSLKSLGAVVAVFLDSSVTHLVSDRLFVGPCGSSAVPSPAASVSPHAHHSPSTSDKTSFPRSRGAAMLERVSSFSGTGYVDPITLAVQWKIPVLTVAKLWAEIAQAESQRKANRSCARNVKSKPSFVKIEPISENWKPDVLKVQKWPALDLDSITGSPFLWNNGQGVNPTHKGILQNTMTRRPYKNSVNNEDDSAEANISGKSSLLSNGHSLSRLNSQEYLRVQCNGLSSNLRSCKLLSPSGSDVLPLPSQRRSTRRASASWCGSTRELSQLSPALSSLSPPISPSDSELGVTLRPKAALSLPYALFGTTAEEHVNSIRRRGGSDASYCSLDASRPRRKKLSPEEKLLQDNKDYFKMEVLHAKLRSSDFKSNHFNNIIKKVPMRSNSSRIRGKDIDSHIEDSIDFEALIAENKAMKLNGVKKTKPRRSELMKLCDEAESFMFGESSRQSAASVPSIAEVSEDELKEDGISCDEVQTRRKRRSHAEAFIHDNQDYYKFETTGSRLRSHGSVSELELTNNTDVEDGAPDIIFSFQGVPKNEPWYDVFKRQDEGREMHFPTFSDPSNQLFLLPYEMPRPLQPRTPFPSSTPSDYYVKRRQRLAQIIAQNHPRKSPRCHASTLAILSSLKKRKRRSSQSVGSESPVRDDFLAQLGLVDDNIDEDLTLLDPVEADSSPNTACASRRKKTEERLTLRVASAVPIEQTPVDVIDLVTEFRNNAPLTSLSVVAATPVRQRGPRRRRKARFNKTGWDKVKARKLQKANDRRMSGGITTENIVTSPRRSVNGSPPAAALSPCVVRVRKINVSQPKACRTLVLTRRRRSTKDYSWTSGKR